MFFMFCFTRIFSFSQGQLKHIFVPERKRLYTITLSGRSEKILTKNLDYIINLPVLLWQSPYETHPEMLSSVLRTLTYETLKIGLASKSTWIFPCMNSLNVKLFPDSHFARPSQSLNPGPVRVTLHSWSAYIPRDRGSEMMTFLGIAAGI